MLIRITQHASTGSNSLPGPGANRCPTTNYLTCNPQCASYPDGQLLCTFYSGAVSCSRFFNYQWWQVAFIMVTRHTPTPRPQVWFQLFVVIWLMVTLLFAKGTFSRASMVSLLTITTLQMVDFTGTFGALVNTAGINNAPGSGDSYVLAVTCSARYQSTMSTQSHQCRICWRPAREHVQLFAHPGRRVH